METFTSHCSRTSVLIMLFFENFRVSIELIVVIILQNCTGVENDGTLLFSLVLVSIDWD